MAQMDKEWHVCHYSDFCPMCEVERLRALVRELEEKLAALREDEDKPKGSPDAWVPRK